MYVSRSQICQYFEDFSAKYGLAKYCKTAHEVKRAAWNDQEGHWRVEVFELATGKTTVEDCEILINAAGVLNQSKWPDIPGLRDFQGQLVHSAKWDEGVELKGKSVGLIGNGYAILNNTPIFSRQEILTVDSVHQASKSSKPFNQ